MRRVLLAAATFAFLLGAENLVITPTSKPSYFDPQGGKVRLVAKSSQGLMAIIQPPNRNDAWRLQVHGGKTVELPIQGYPVLGLSEAYVVWSPNRLKDPFIYVYRMSDEKLINYPFPLGAGFGGISNIRIIGDKAYMIDFNRRNPGLHRMNLKDGHFETLAPSLYSSGEIVRFGESNERELVLVDAVAGQFRVDSIEGTYQPGVWKFVYIPPNLPANHFSLLAHFRGTDGSHLFVASGRLSAIRMSSEGREVQRFGLAFPKENRAHINFDLAASTGNGFEVVSQSGD